jgi:hypothetical protein
MTFRGGGQCYKDKNQTIPARQGPVSIKEVVASAREYSFEVDRSRARLGSRLSLIGRYDARLQAALHVQELLTADTSVPLSSRLSSRWASYHVMTQLGAIFRGFNSCDRGIFGSSEEMGKVRCKLDDS